MLKENNLARYFYLRKGGAYFMVNCSALTITFEVYFIKIDKNKGQCLEKTKNSID